MSAQHDLRPSTSVLAWLLGSDEPAARWIALTRLQDRPGDDTDVVAAHRAVVADAGTRALIERLPDWEAAGPLSGHDSPAYAPNLLMLLADMGVGPGDDPRVDDAVAALLSHQDEVGRLATPATISRIDPEPGLSALLCDHNAITEVLVRFGMADDKRVRLAIDRIAADLTTTAQGQAWPCLPSQGFRGPGRKGDVCPQVTLQALRMLARLPIDRRPVAPEEALPAARTALGVWSNRGAGQPYMFGHGLAFKTVKWPPYWYRSLAVVDTLGFYPALWRGPDADPADRRALAELAACVLAYNVDEDGRVTPRSCYRGFEAFSFGQKKRPSPFATARLFAALTPFADLASEVAAVDVSTVASSKGGTGTPVPPRA
jgi:hypothetical protein